jgi:hypothetical protein
VADPLHPAEVLAMEGKVARRHSLVEFAEGACILASLLTVACSNDDTPNWVQFNGPDDNVTIEVGASKVTGAVTTDLHSSTGEVLIGTASVDPGGGPIGTEHLARVDLFDAFEGEVGRSTVRTDSGSRGIDEYDMAVDSADEGLYTLTLKSVGSEGELRSDTFTFRLWYDAPEDVTDTSSK